MTKKSLLFAFMTFINIIILFGQIESNIYKGHIISSEDGHGLEDVICQVLDQNNRTLDFCFSNKDGYFELKKKESNNSLFFRLLGYESQKLLIKELDDSESIIISMVVSNFNLQEIVITVPPIEISNDTLRYNVNQFISQEDKYIVDVLRKLPGIKIAENGTISYQGEAINKFYIEGRDLLGGQYNLATNNLDVNAVTAVEVLENNQHIKALKGIEFSEKTAINLKLKKGYTIRPFGEVQLGIGGDPVLYDEKIFAAYLGGKIQTMANLKVNNTGDYILDEMENKLDIGSLFSFEPLAPNFINPPTPLNVPLNSKRHLFNNTYLGSINTLIPLSKDSELTVNLSYGHDRIDQNFDLTQNIAIQDDILKIEEQSELKRKLSNGRLSVLYENNGLNKYIKSEIVYYNKSEDAKSNINSNAKDLSVYTKNNPYYIQNNFQALFKFKENKTINVTSFLRFSDNGESLRLAFDKANLEDLHESFNSKYVISKNLVGSSFNLFRNRLNMELSMIYKKRDVDNELYLKNLDNLNSTFELLPEQKNKTELLQVALTPKYQIKKEGGRFVFTINLESTYSKYDANNYNGISFTDERFIFAPAISGNYRINHQWELYSRLGYDFRYADDISLLDAPFFRNYRTVYIPSNTLNGSTNYYVSGRLRYKDIVNLLFFNVHVLYRDSKYDYITKSYNTAEWSYYTTAYKENKGYLFTVNSDITKTFIPIMLSLTLNPSYTRLRSNIIQQDILVHNTNNVFSLLAKAELKSINKINLIYSAQGKVTCNQNSVANSLTLKDLMQKFKLYFLPNKNIDILLVSDYILYEREKGNYSSFFFLDIAGKYRYKRLVFDVSINNIFNNDVLSTTYLSTVNSSYQRLPLRGREFIFTTTFNF